MSVYVRHTQRVARVGLHELQRCSPKPLHGVLVGAPLAVLVGGVVVRVLAVLGGDRRARLRVRREVDLEAEELARVVGRGIAEDLLEAASSLCGHK